MKTRENNEHDVEGEFEDKIKYQKWRTASIMMEEEENW